MIVSCAPLLEKGALAKFKKKNTLKKKQNDTLEYHLVLILEG